MTEVTNRNPSTIMDNLYVPEINKRLKRLPSIKEADPVALFQGILHRRDELHERYRGYTTQKRAAGCLNALKGLIKDLDKRCERYLIVGEKSEPKTVCYLDINNALVEADTTDILYEYLRTDMILKDFHELMLRFIDKDYYDYVHAVRDLMLLQGYTEDDLYVMGSYSAVYDFTIYKTDSPEIVKLKKRLANWGDPDYHDDDEEED